MNNWTALGVPAPSVRVFVSETEAGDPVGISGTVLMATTKAYLVSLDAEHKTCIPGYTRVWASRSECLELP